MADPHSFDFPRQACAQSLAARFEEIAREAPGRLALRHGARSVMYDELNRQSNRLAQALLGQLTGQDATILLLLRDPIHHVVAQLGLSKPAGPAFQSMCLFRWRANGKLPRTPLPAWWWPSSRP